MRIISLKQVGISYYCGHFHLLNLVHSPRIRRHFLFYRCLNSLVPRCSTSAVLNLRISLDFPQISYEFALRAAISVN